MDPERSGGVVQNRLHTHLGDLMTFANPLSDLQPGALGNLLQMLKRSAMLIVGLLVIVAGILIAPLPGPGGVPVIALGLILVLRSSYWAKRQFIRAQYARPRYVYPFRRLLRKNPEIAPVFWQQALRAEKVVLKRTHRRLARLRRSIRRTTRRIFG